MASGGLAPAFAAAAPVTRMSQAWAVASPSLAEAFTSAPNASRSPKHSTGPQPMPMQRRTSRSSGAPVPMR